MPQISCNKVLLPDPLRLMMPTVSPFLISKEKSCNAVNFPVKAHPTKNKRLLDTVAGVTKDAVFLGEIPDRDGDFVRVHRQIHRGCAGKKRSQEWLPPGRWPAL